MNAMVLEKEVSRKEKENITSMIIIMIEF